MRLGEGAALGLAAFFLGLAASAGGTGAAAPAAPKAPQAYAELELARLNRPFRDVPVAVEPVESGPLHVALASPRHELQLLRHRLRLRRLADGTHDAELWAQFQGTGHLTADVSALGLGTRLQDDVVLPRQEKVLRARLRIARSRDGYLLTPVALPKDAVVQIRSRLGGDIVRWCDRVPFSLLDCDGVEASLSTATVPLPAPGDTYLLANADLTAEDRRALDAYLAAK